MMVSTFTGKDVDSRLLQNYFQTLVNNFFKVLPMKENGETSLPAYMLSLQSELLGCRELIVAVKYDSLYLTLISILQFLIDNPDCEIHEVRREVFKAISICNKLQSRYQTEVV